MDIVKQRGYYIYRPALLKSLIFFFKDIKSPELAWDSFVAEKGINCNTHGTDF
jgi:hypothetical protein